MDKTLKIIEQPIKHDSASKHVTGNALYTDDILEPQTCLHGWLIISPVAHGIIEQLNLTKASQSEGVVTVITAKDIPQDNNISCVYANDEPLLAEEELLYYGQPICVIIAKTFLQAQQASKKVELKIKTLPAILDIDQALKAKSFITKPIIFEKWKINQHKVAHQISDELITGGQEHFYLEGQVALAIPKEENIQIYCSTQDPSTVQDLVAKVLGVKSHSIKVAVRRLGGGFGGKESQAAIFAALAGVSAVKTNKPVKIRLDRDQDIKITGKRHDYKSSYKVGFDDKGQIEFVDISCAANCGYASDLSVPVSIQSLCHIDGPYYLKNLRFKFYHCKTNKVSNTAFRGFGSPQVAVIMQKIIEDIACYLHKDSYEISKINFYDKYKRNITHYGQKIKDCVIQDICESLINKTQYFSKKESIKQFNKQNQFIKKGLGFMPIKFGISFHEKFFSQAGALIHIYKDGSVYLNHGGVEMGQGLMTKVSQVVAEELAIDLDNIKITDTNIEQVPNTIATAASSGTDLNAMAVLNAIQKLKTQLINFTAKLFKVSKKNIVFKDNKVYYDHNKFITFKQLISKAFINRIPLSATGYYKVPKVHWDNEKFKGRPSYYFTYGAALSEVSVDILTGEISIDKVDILHDVGKSLNPAIDKGQIEGAFIQGMGWLTTEQLWWNDKGELKTHAPSTYKIPVCGNAPKKLNIDLLKNENIEPTIYRSKAVGEPPILLATSVFLAINNAIASLVDYKYMPKLTLPATNENILYTISMIKQPL